MALAPIASDCGNSSRPLVSTSWSGTGPIAGLTLLWPSARTLFRFGPLHADDLALTLGAGGLVLATLELLQPRWRARLQSQQSRR